jgi:hypothetical protein
VPAEAPGSIPSPQSNPLKFKEPINPDLGCVSPLRLTAIPTTFPIESIDEVDFLGVISYL